LKHSYPNTSRLESSGIVAEFVTTGAKASAINRDQKVPNQALSDDHYGLPGESTIPLGVLPYRNAGRHSGTRLGSPTQFDRIELRSPKIVESSE
jgi:hypothetical protein